jgi:AcrR family transcriptional regulator
VPASEQMITRPRQNGTPLPRSSNGASPLPEGSLNGYTGPHALTRSRMLRAMLEVVAEHGYAGTSTTLVVARARGSRKTFYEHFENCEDCFLAAFEDALEEVAHVAAPAYERDGRWSERMRAALEALLGFLDEDRAIASLLFLEAPTAGPAVQERRTRAVQSLQTVIEEGRSQARTDRTPPPLTAETVLGGVIAVIQARLACPRPTRLMTLLSPLMGVIVHPYLGPAAASKELARPTPKRPSRPQPAEAPAAQSDPLEGLHMRVTYRTLRVLVAIGEHPGARNREIAAAAGVTDEGQISKLLARLDGYELIQNSGEPSSWAPNQWHLTARGEEVEHGMRQDPLASRDTTSHGTSPFALSPDREA